MPRAPRVVSGYIAYDQFIIDKLKRVMSKHHPGHCLSDIERQCNGFRYKGFVNKHHGTIEYHHRIPGHPQIITSLKRVCTYIINDSHDNDNNIHSPTTPPPQQQAANQQQQQSNNTEGSSSFDSVDMASLDNKLDEKMIEIRKTLSEVNELKRMYDKWKKCEHVLREKAHAVLTHLT